MLRITPQNSATDAKSYFSSADYYIESEEVIGRWGGKGAQLLGLDGTVSRNGFNRLCDNLHPATGERLTARTRSDRTVGYDFTFSCPKSVSILHALADDKDILDAFRKAVDETMRDIETEMKVRVRTKGSDGERPSNNMLWAEYIHKTSRPIGGIPDVQLHSHCFAINASFDAKEDKWKAGQFREIKRNAPYYQAAFRARLANRLQDLGYSLTRKKGDFEIAGIPASVIKKFSRRTEKIEKLAREQGIVDPEAKARLGALTREKKDKNLTWPELLSEWNHRLSPQERKAIDAVRAGRDLPVARVDRTKEAVDFAIAHEFEREAVVSEKRLLATALAHGIGDVTTEEVCREYARRKLPVEEKHGIRLVTTPAIIAEEEKLVAFARDGRGTCRPLGVPGRAIEREYLNAGQRRAVNHILTSRDRVMLIRGSAGTGKTELMQEAVAGIKQGGHAVVALAPTAGASRDVLRKAGFKEADTVSAFLRSQDMQQKAAGNVIWVDEGGLMGNKDMTALFDMAARVNARVVLMGDGFQHASVARGTPFTLLERQAGLRSVAVRDIVRQKGDYRTAVKHLSEGKTLAALDKLEELGWINEVADKDRYLRLADAYLAASAERKADGSFKSALVVTPTHAEAEKITDSIRSELARKAKSPAGNTRSKTAYEEKEFAVWIPKHLTEAEKGVADNYSKGDMLQFHQHAKGFKSGTRVIVTDDKLPLEHASRFEVFQPRTIKIATGDRLRITANATIEGHRLDNGSLYSVKGFRDGNIVLDNDWTIPQEFGHIAHGYAVTSHASQGKTVDKVLVGVSGLSYGAADRTQMYVSVSRGREQALLFTDSKKELREVAARERERMTATELMRRRKKPGRERLKRHLSFLRRLIGFEALHQRRKLVHELPLQRKGVAHER